MPTSEEPPRSWLHKVLLDKAPVIVLARLEKDEITPIHEIQVTSFTVVETFKGRKRKTVLVGGMGRRGGAFKDLEKVLFLRPMKSGRIHELVDSVDLTVRDEDHVPDTIRAYLRIGLEDRPAPRQRALFDLSMRNLRSRSVFATRVAARELSGLADVAPHLFKASDHDAIRQARRTVPRASAADHSRLLRKVSRLIGAHFSRAEEVYPPGPARDELRAAIRRFRALTEPRDRITLMDAMAKAAGRRLRLFCEGAMLDESAEVRARAAYHLGEFGVEASSAVLLRELDGARGAELEARIEALGKIGHQDSLKPVLRLIGRRHAVDKVLEAVARIGGIEAQNVLERVERSLVGKVGEEARLKRIRYYRSDAFAKAEAKRRLDARKNGR